MADCPLFKSCSCKYFYYNNTTSIVPDKYFMLCIFHNINLQLKHVLTHYFDTCSYELTFFIQILQYFYDFFREAFPMTDTALSAMGKNKSKCVIYYISVLREPLICDSDQSVSPSVYSKQLSRIQLFPLALCGSYIVR